MNQVYAVVSDIRKDEHMVKLHYVCHGEKDKIDELKNNKDIEFHETFDTEDEATKFMKTTTLNNTKYYTNMLREQGLPDKSKLLRSHSRYLLAYLGDDITTIPNVYTIPIYEFIILQENYPSVRRATQTEIEQTTIDNSVIPMTPDTFDSIKKLQLLKLQVSLSNNSEDIQKVEKDYDVAYLNTMKLMAGLQNGQTENIDQLMSDLLPGQDPSIIEEVKSALSKMIQYVNTARKEGMSDQEIEQELFAGMGLPD